MSNVRKISKVRKIYNAEETKKDYQLDEKIQKFNMWCFENKIKNRYTDTGVFRNRNNYLDFIEKMAVWYELRYPESEIINIFGEKTKFDVNKEIFDNNPYVREHFAGYSSLKTIDWKEFYNFNAFLATLSSTEESYLVPTQYDEIVYIDKNIYISAHLHLTPDGFVTEIDFSYKFFEDTYDLKKLIGIHIKDVLKILYELKIINSKDNPIECTIKKYEKDYYFIDELLNCVMYRIIERGGRRTGPRRAFLFAKEFERNIEVPMQYGIDTSDPHLHNFIIEYLNAGGRKDIDCYENYFSLKNKKEKVEVVNLEQIIDLELSNLIHIGNQEDYEILYAIAKDQKQLVKK